MINNKDIRSRINTARHSSLIITQIKLETDVTDAVKNIDKKTIKSKIKKIKEFKQKEREFSKQSRVRKIHQK